jgi:CheY-like chemotaxis protein
MKKTILLVDDDSDDRQLFCEALECVDASVICYYATDGKEALDVLAKKETPQLIFLDINMPHMNGWQCLKAIKESEIYKHIPVLMYSTSSNQREVDMALNLGALCFFTKPDNFSELKNILEVVAENLHKNLLGAISHFNAIKSRKTFACSDDKS